LVVLLDVRSFRDARHSNGDILGEAQWKWLEETLRTHNAQVILIGSGSQILPTEHRFEKWADYPGSRARFLDLIAKSPAARVILITGDRHFGEISRIEHGGREIVEVTSSGMTHSYEKLGHEPNVLRVGEPFTGLNFGTAAFDWNAAKLSLAVRDKTGAAVREITVSLPQ
jgi:alkaline phosphatase D